MGKPGAKKLDKIISVTPGDVHIIMVPSPGGPVPTPIPHPCNSIIKDKVAKKVKVMGQPGAVKGSISKHTPPHVPMGPGPFQKPPANKGVIITGSSNVFYEGKAAAMLGDTGKMCADPADAPVGKVIGTATMVLVGGGGSGSDGARAAAATQAMQAAAAACHKWINANMPPGADREQAHRDVCTATGHPIDVATGKMFTKNIDLELPGRIPFEFTRNYSSARSDLGAFGRSWRHSYETQLIIHHEFVAYRDHNGRFLEFEPIAVGESSRNELTWLKLVRLQDGYVVEALSGLKQFFSYSGEPSSTASIVPIQQIADRFDNRITFNYKNNRLTQITHSAGHIILIDYNDRGFVKALGLIADPVDRTAQTIRTYIYSKDDDLIEVRDIDDNVYRFEYANHLLVREIDRNGFSFYFTYDCEGWCQETWGDGGIFYRRFYYDRMKRLTRVNNSLGYATLYSWNELGVVITETDHHNNTWSFEYNDALECVRVEDPIGNIWTNEYDEMGQLTTAEDPEGGSAAYKWDDMGRLITYTDPAGRQWRREYDEGRREVRSIAPTGGAAIEIRNERGDLIKIRHPNNRETVCTYDDAGHLLTVATSSGLRISRTYNTTGDLLSESDQLGLRLEIEYDRMRRPTRIWRCEKGETKFKFDAEGRITSTIDAKGRVTDYEYTQFDRVKRIIQPPVTLFDGSTIRPIKNFTYDTENRVTAVEMPGDETVCFHYDGRSRPMRVEYPEGRMQSFERDGRGFVTSLCENGSLLFKQDSDSDGRVLRRVTGDGEEFTFEYDPIGNLINGSGTGSIGTVKFERDDLGRIVAEYGALGCQELRYGGSSTKIDYAWNDELQLACASALTAGGTLWKASRNGTEEIRLDYDLRDRLKRAAFASGEVHELSYDSSTRPASRRIIDSIGGVKKEDFHYDLDGWLTSKEVDGTVTQRYERDSLNRLVLMVNEERDGPRQFSWGFDQAGNRVLATDAGGLKYRNQYLRGHQLVDAGGERLTYDKHGRVTSRTDAAGRTMRFAWDVIGRLRSVELPEGETIEMRYDALGRRIEKTGPDGTTRFGWAGTQLVHELRPDGEERHYLYQANSFRPLASYIRRADGDWHLHTFLNDLRGAPLRMTGDNGETVWQANVAPWGEIDAVNRFDQPLAMPGQYHDHETGLYYNYARYYLPRAAAYLSPDPTGLDGGDDAYAYVADPVCWTDPTGLSADDYRDAAAKLPQLRGKSETEIRQILEDNGFSQIHVSNSPARNETWDHPDGSQVRIHPYGNQNRNMQNGNLTPKSGLNAHVHKEDPAGQQLTDRGIPSTNPDETHIGIKNPQNLPAIRGRPHGDGA